MSEKDRIKWRSVDRRKFIAGVGAGATAGIAGCGGGGGDATPTQTESPTEGDDDGMTTATDTPTDTATATPSQEIIRGGTPVAAAGEPWQHMNIMKGGGGGSIDPVEFLYTRGARRHPNTAKPIPWAYTSWELTPENAKENPSSPTIIATLRDGLEFHDGKKITAEDAAFTYNYMMEQETTGESALDQVTRVEVDKDKGNKVLFYFTEQTAFWNTQGLTHPIVPKHIWKNVSDFSKYSPRQEGELIGSSVMKFSDTNWPDWIEFEMQPKEVIPYNGDDRYPWLHPEGPFIDSWRLQLFQSRSSLFQALMDGEVHMGSDTVTLSRAVKANESDDHEVYEALDNDFTFHAFNTRRVPFDDVAFRQFLSKAMNRNWMVKRLRKGIGAEANYYSTSTMYDEWRPPEPDELVADADDPYEAAEYQGITLPDLTWPSDSLDYGENIPDEDVTALRDFLLNHPDAKYDYSLGEAKSEQVKSRDDKAIYVDGKPITEVHTNNQGEAGQGPLEMSMGGPGVDPLAFPRQNNWVTVLQIIGVPVQRAVEPWDAQYPKIYLNENFDMHEQDWGNSLSWPQTHIEWQFHSDSADLELNQDVAMWNAPAYTGADDLIDESMSMMDHEKRKEPTKKVFAKVYRDAPNMPVGTYVNLLPASKEFVGYVVSQVAFLNRSVWTPLNIRLNPEFQ